MSVREIVTIGDPVLRKPTREVTLDELRTPVVQELIDDLIETRRATNGAGIAANQVGESLRIAIAEVEGTNPRYPYKPPIPLTVMVNPALDPVGEETVEINEGCLSVPDLRADLVRHLSVRIRYLDRDGNPHDDVVDGLAAGTFQHEVDHLDGKLFVDRADPRTFATWDQFERHHRDEFLARIGGLAHREGS